MKLEMKIVPVALVFLLLAIGSYAQSTTTASSQTTQTLQCRDMKSGDFIGPDESIMKNANGQYMVCHVVKPDRPTPQSNPAPQAPSIKQQAAERSNQVPVAQQASIPDTSVKPRSNAGNLLTSSPDASIVSSNSSKPPESESSRNSTVVLYRPSRFIDSARKETIYIDNRPLCILGNGTSFSFEVQTGLHSLTTLYFRSTKGETALPESAFKFIEGQIYYFTVATNGLIFAVPSQQGEKETKHTKPIKPKAVLFQPSGNELN